MSIQFCVSEVDAVKRLRCWRDQSSTCMGSLCMAWRWIKTNVPDKDGDLVVSGDTHGYCGVAGKPWVAE